MILCQLYRLKRSYGNFKTMNSHAMPCCLAEATWPYQLCVHRYRRPNNRTNRQHARFLYNCHLCDYFVSCHCHKRWHQILMHVHSRGHIVADNISLVQPYGVYIVFAFQ